MKAYLTIKKQPNYRADAFEEGLKACGHSVTSGLPRQIDSDTLLIIWNRYFEFHDVALKVEAAKGIVLVAENGYIGPNGISPVHMEPRSIYALARSYHNDSAVVGKSSAERWNKLNVELKPWRIKGEHILLAPNRPFGVPGRMMGVDWAADAKLELQAQTKREIRWRGHPGNNAPRVPLAADLKDACATAIWSSSVGVHSLCAGIPVICDAPFWIAKEATFGSLRVLEESDSKDNFSGSMNQSRLRAMERLACAQFDLQEIRSGFAFDFVLGDA